MPAGNTPGASAVLSTVTVTWAANSFPGGTPVPGYLIRRFNSLTQVEGTVLAACSGIRSGTSCVESGVPAGTWRYTVTPAAGVWRGAQSAQSTAVIVI